MNDIRFGEKVTTVKYYNGVPKVSEFITYRVKIEDDEDLKRELDLIVREISMFGQDVEIGIEVNKQTKKPRFITKKTRVQ